MPWFFLCNSHYLQVANNRYGDARPMVILFICLSQLFILPHIIHVIHIVKVVEIIEVISVVVVIAIVVIVRVATI